MSRFKTVQDFKLRVQDRRDRLWQCRTFIFANPQLTFLCSAMRPSTSTHVLSDPESEPDIFSSLTGNKNKKRKIQQDEDSEDGHEGVSPNGFEGDEDDDLNTLIRETVARRDKKDGTKLLKKTKGSKKIAKGETGGGSFQSMGK